MPKYQITIYKHIFGQPKYLDDDEITCKNKWEANKRAKEIANFHRRKNIYKISYDVKKM